MSEILMTIPQGKLRGSVEEDINGKEYFSFLGIPYAKPPLGSLRFKDPQPPEPWDGLHDATKEGQPCYTKQITVPEQTETGGFSLGYQLAGSEDCLFLNIFTRELLKPKPVLVYIHGGAFTLGSSSVELQGPKLLITEDIVLVTINYRLGVLGFLSAENEGIGNAGLKDMVQALKWIQQNIKFFGGDPDNVTVFGISAGGAAVQYLVLSPLAKGLFHRAIAQSGSALNYWAAGKQNNFADIAKVTGCTTVEQLQKLPVDKLLQAQFEMGDRFTNPSYIRYFSPTVERESPSAFMSTLPIEAVTSGRFNQVDFIMGYTNLEGMPFVDYLPMMSDMIDDSYLYFVPHFLDLEIDSEEYKEVNKKILQFYFGQDSVDRSNKTALYDYYTDITFLRGIFTSVKLQAKTSTKPVYLYRFSADTKINFFKVLLGLTNPPSGAGHGDDMSYLFKTHKEPVIEPGSAEHAVMRRMVKMWTGFAKNGTPTCGEAPEWTPVTKDSVNYLEIGNELSMHHGTVSENDRMKFWDSIFANYDY